MASTNPLSPCPNERMNELPLIAAQSNQMPLQFDRATPIPPCCLLRVIRRLIGGPLGRFFLRNALLRPNARRFLGALRRVARMQAPPQKPSRHTRAQSRAGRKLGKQTGFERDRSSSRHGSASGTSLRVPSVPRDGQGRSAVILPQRASAGHEMERKLFDRLRNPDETLDRLPSMIPFLQLGPLQVPTFGLMVAAAILTAYFVLRSDLARRGIAPKDSGLAELFIAVPSLAGIIGAKLYHVLESPRDLFADPIGQIFSRYGLAWFGGLLAGFAAFTWLARRRKIPLLTMFDVGSPAAAVGYGIGRIGCLLSGDGDYGKPTTLPWGMSFPHGLVPTTQTCVEWGWPPNCRVQPTPIYEFIAACVIAWLLWRLGARQIAAMRARGEGTTPMMPPAPVRRSREQASVSAAMGATRESVDRPFGFWRSFSLAPQAGQIFAAYLALTGLERFLVEFIRINPRSFFGMSNAQTAGLVSLIAGGLLAWRLQKTHRARPSSRSGSSRQA